MLIEEDIYQGDSETRLTYCLIYAVDQQPSFQPLGLGHIAASLKSSGINYSFFSLVRNNDIFSIERWIMKAFQLNN